MVQFKQSDVQLMLSRANNLEMEQKSMSTPAVDFSSDIHVIYNMKYIVADGQKPYISIFHLFFYAVNSRGQRHYVFGLSVSPILGNTISQKHLKGSSSNLASMSTWTH